jgi:hypothetical protein
MGHPLFDPARRPEALELEGDMGATQRKGGRDPVLGHFDRTFVCVGVPQETGEVDENPLSDGYGRHSLRPPKR